MSVTLKGLRFYEEIEEECESLEAAIKRATEWQEEYCHDESYDLYDGSLTYAAPIKVVDSSGNVLLDEKSLDEEIRKIDR